MVCIYGPVYSWRLGRSLGIDLISEEKTCSFDCIYCQVGITKKFSMKREVFIKTSQVINEFKNLPKLDIDYITFSGNGEPTLAKNLGEVILEIRRLSKFKIAVLTNSTLMNDISVRKELSLADLVVAKLDASSDEQLKIMNNPAKGCNLNDIVKGIKKFNKEYPGKLSLQVMLLSQNKDFVKDIAAIAKEINPIEVELNTPLRECNVKPLLQNDLQQYKSLFFPLSVRTVYEAKKKKTGVLDKNEVLKRRPGGII